MNVNIALFHPLTKLHIVLTLKKRLVKSQKVDITYNLSNTFYITDLSCRPYKIKTCYPHLNEYAGGAKCQESLYHNLMAEQQLTKSF